MQVIPYKCALCGSSRGYNSLESSLGKSLADAGFPYSLDAFETLSYKRYQCLNCSASDRDRLYALYINKTQIFSPKKKVKIVDFAPSPALSGFLKSQPGAIYRSADLFMESVDDKVDITDMKTYKNNQFDFFICSHLLEHVSSDEKALNELRRILKNGGRGILMTPIIDKHGVMDEDVNLKDKAEQIRRFAQDDHVRLYERRIFLERVRESGLKIETITWQDLGLINWLRNGLTLKSKLYVVHK